MRRFDRPNGAARRQGRAPRIIGNAVVLLAGQVALTLSTAVTMFALARYLGTAEFGEYSAVIAFVGMFLPIATLSLDLILIREITRNPEKSDAILSTGLALRLSASVVAIALCVGTSIWLDYSPREQSLILLWSLSVLFSAGQVLQIPFAVALNNSRPVKVSSLLAVLGTLAKLGLIAAGMPLVSFLIFDLVWSLALSVFLWRIAFVHAHVRLRWTVDRGISKRLLLSAMPLVTAGILVAIYHRIDQQFLLAWQGPQEVGEYAAAVRFAELLSLAPMLLMRSAFPVISAPTSGSPDPLRTSSTCYRYLFLMTFPWIMLSVFFAPQVISLIYGDAYSNASAALPWLMIAQIPVIAGIVYGHFSIAAHLQKFDVLFTLINAVTHVLLCIILIPRAGIVGAAIASLAGYSISVPAQLLFRETRGYSLVLLREALRVSVVGLATWLAFVLTQDLLPIAVAFGATVLVYFGSSIVTRLIKREDIRFVTELVSP